MISLENEQNIDVLRLYTLYLRDQVKDLTQQLSKLKNLNEEEKQQWLDEKLRDQLSRLQKQIYGKGSESLQPRDDRPVGHKEEQLKLHGQYPQEGKELPKEPFKPQGPVTYVYKMSPGELAAESVLRGIKAGAEAWDEVPGLFQTSTEMTVIERIYQEVTHQQCKYRLKTKFNTADKEILITAPGPAKVRPGSHYSVDFAVSVAIDKYEYHLPLERQRRKMEAQGLDIEVKTLYGLCEAVAEHCNSVRERIKQDIFNDFCSVHVDESTWPIQGQLSQSYMWALSNRRGSYFQFEPTRSGKVAEEILKTYRGSILTDGYGGYNRVKNVESQRLARCWSHARREFYDRFDDYPTQVTEAIGWIDKLFSIEAKAKTFDELRVLRKTESKDVIQEFYQWMLKTRSEYLQSVGLNQAISYSLKFWKELTLFLEDLSVPLSNNDAERALRHIVMGRKNFNGSKTINGADTAASIYTVIESCKKVGLSPSQYLKYLIEARWFGDPLKTPYELSMEKLGPNKKVIFPEKQDWKI